MMSQKEHKEFSKILQKERQVLATNKGAAQKLLTDYGFLNAKGKLKKKFRTEK